jgi:glycosyltransferase involved in cell wall biosynthesis
MKLSILILTHNRPELFKRAINSVLNNLPEYDIEILVNNDTSDIDEIHDDRVSIQYHYFQHDDLSCVYKYLFDLATGEYIYYLEDDDYIIDRYFLGLDFDTDVCYIEYISIPLINEFGSIEANNRAKSNRKFKHITDLNKFLQKIDTMYYQLGQIIFRKDLIKIFPTGNIIHNDYNLVKHNANAGRTVKYYSGARWIQTQDGLDNISYTHLNTDNRFYEQL